jgi:hypothetical protein
MQPRGDVGERERKRTEVSARQPPSSSRLDAAAGDERRPQGRDEHGTKRGGDDGPRDRKRDRDRGRDRSRRDRDRDRDRDRKRERDRQFSGGYATLTPHVQCDVACLLCSALGDCLGVRTW